MVPLSNHAKFEMQRRGVSEAEVEAVFREPGQKIKLASGREIWQNKIEKEGKVYVVRIIVETVPTMKIVTIYRSSKVKKYWRLEI